MASAAGFHPPGGRYEYFKMRLAGSSKGIAEDWVLLKKIVERDYSRICHTWREQAKTEQARRNILKCVIEDSPFPSLSYEDLVYGDNILTFAYYRAKYHWTEYVHTDLYSMRAGFAPSAGQPDFHGFWAPGEDGVLCPVEPPSETIGKLLHLKKRDFGEIREGQRCHFDDYCEEYSSTNQSKFNMRNRLTNRKAQATGIDVLDKLSYSQALLVVATQQRFFGFLVDICLEIMKRSRENAAPGVQVSKADLRKEYEEYQFQDKNLPPPKVRPGGAMPLLAEVRLRATYGPPDGFQWDVLEELIDTRLANARITLLQLRKDPDIFEAMLRREEWKLGKNYDPTVVPDLEPKPGEFDGPARRKAWQDAMKYGIGYAIKDFDWWSELQAAFNHLKTTHEECKEKLKTKDKSEEFWAAAKKLDTALYGFRYRAHHFSETLIEGLRKTIVDMPYFKGVYRTQPGHGSMQIALTDAVKQEAPEKRIDILTKLSRLLTSHRHQFGLSALLDDLERELMDSPGLRDPEPSGQDYQEEASAQDDQNKGPSQDVGEDAPGEGASTGQKKKKKKKKKAKTSSDGTEKSNKHYLTEEVLKILGNLAVFAECLSQVEHFQPWAALYFADWNADPQKEAVRESVKQLDQHFLELTGSDRAWKKHVQKGLPIRGRFHYPIEELRTQENVDLLELAESNLDHFWHDLVKELNPAKQDALSARARALLEATPERPRWVVQEPEELAGDKPMPEAQEKQEQTQIQEEEQVGREIEMRDATEASAEASRPKTPSPPKRPREEDEEPPEQSPTKKRKNKAPAQPATAAKTSTKSTENRQQQRPDTDHPGKIWLSRKLYPYVLYLFCIPGRTDARKNLKWKDFLKLMAYMGFSFEHSGGSVCKFVPVSKELIAKIPPQRTKTNISLEVHNPHPETFLRFTQCRRIGESMRSAYNWDSGTFEPL